jgi:hypothetical protein
MKNKVTILFLFFFIFSFSQNWDVFNRNYRYNYKYNYSSLISNVLFVDTVKAVGIDTVYSLNRIGLVCNGSCPTLSIIPTTTVLVTNIPQFLQRNIRRYNNGLVKLYDTTKIVINPYCVLNQTWLFDSVYNLTAQCVLINTENIFSSVDSVKTILINNVDTLKLSKQFGVIQFPELYAKNKYYRLVGIEKRKYYDSIPFLGLRVPNAWDFYNYNVGDQMWTTSSYYYGSGPMAPTSCQIFKKTIKSKTILPDGFVYNMDEYGVSYSVPGIFSCNQYLPNPPSLNNFNISFTGLTKDSLIENRMFPNMVAPLFGNITPKNITKFGLDNNGIFYKYFGPSCNSSPITVMPNQTAVNGFDSFYSNPAYYSILSSGEKYALCYGVGFGEINSNYDYFETFSDFCLNKFIKNNITYFGGSNILGLEETSKEQSGLVYPNPANSVLNFRLEGAFQIKIYNSVGQLVLNKQLDDTKELDVSNFNSGIYLIKMKNDSYSLEKKIIIRH